MLKQEISNSSYSYSAKTNLTGEKSYFVLANPLSKMWTPTHVQVTVQRAKGLLCKGKNGTNDVFVTIALGKEKYQTSVKEKATDPVTWLEECELPIPKQGNKAEIVLTALHRNFIGDEFLGMISIPLSEFDVYEKPRNKWYALKSKPGKEKNKNRGELEVRIGFTVVANSNAELNKKSHKSSLGHLASSVGGSLLSLGKESKGGLKNLVHSVGNKVSTLPGRGRKKKDKGESVGSIPEQRMSASEFKKQSRHDADPGVISDEEDEFRFDELSHKSSHSSLAVSQRGESLENLGGGEFLRRTFATPPPAQLRSTPPVINEEQVETWNADPTDSIDDWEAKLFGKQNSVRKSTTPEPSKSPVTVSKFTPSPLGSRTHLSVNDHGVNSDERKPDEIIFKVVKTEKLENEPIPKPRQLQDIIKSESKAKSMSLENISSETKKEEKPKKEKHKHISKDSFTSLFGSKTKLNVDDSKSSSPPTPIGITNPIRMKGSPQTQHETRLPKETLRKFEAKSREDLIETIMALQSQVTSQKQKLSDMEDYIDNLLVRVMENKPTLLQNPSNGAEDQGKTSVMLSLYGKASRSTARTID